MKNWLREFRDLFATLIADVEDLSRLAHAGSSQASRSYVRAVFALIEGITYAMKQVAASASAISLDAAERALLNEESYALDLSGKPQTRSAYQTNIAKRWFRFCKQWRSVTELISSWTYQVVGGRVCNARFRLDIA